MNLCPRPGIVDVANLSRLAAHGVSLHQCLDVLEEVSGVVSRSGRVGWGVAATGGDGGAAGTALRPN
jgi:hypothetical protein